MKKISLHLDSLRVESFAPGAEPAGRGTVAAHQMTAPFTQQPNCTYDGRCMSFYTCPEQVPHSYLDC